MGKGNGPTLAYLQKKINMRLCSKVLSLLSAEMMVSVFNYHRYNFSPAKENTSERRHLGKKREAKNQCSHFRDNSNYS